MGGGKADLSTLTDFSSQGSAPGDLIQFPGEFGMGMENTVLCISINNVNNIMSPQHSSQMCCQ